MPGINNNSIQERAENRRMYILKDSIDRLGETFTKNQRESQRENDEKMKALEEKVAKLEAKAKKDKEKEEFEMY